MAERGAGWTVSGFGPGEPFNCKRCGRHITEHHVSHDQAPPGLIEGVFSRQTFGFYCPPSDSVCPGGHAEQISHDASRCPTCGYTFTTVPDDPALVPPHRQASNG